MASIFTRRGVERVCENEHLGSYIDHPPVTFASTQHGNVDTGPRTCLMQQKIVEAANDWFTTSEHHRHNGVTHRGR